MVGEKKLSVAHCKRLMNRNGNNYTDEEIEKIRDFLYVMAEIALNGFLKKQEQRSKGIEIDRGRPSKISDNSRTSKTKKP